MKKYFLMYLVILMSGFLFTLNVVAATHTTIYDVRAGVHDEFTRLVLDSGGAHPFKIGPATSKGITIQYEALDFLVDAKHLSRSVDGGIAKISHLNEQNPSAITITFRQSNLQVKTYYLPEEPPKEGFYKLVLDLHPPKNPEPEKAEVVKTSQNARPAGSTRIQDIRTGIHPGFTRLVLNSEGYHPLEIGLASSEGITIRYEALDLLMEPRQLSRCVDGDVVKISYNKQQSHSDVTITFRQANSRVITYFLPEEPPKKGFYKLVLDLYPPSNSEPDRAKPASSKAAVIKAPEKIETISSTSNSPSKNEEAPKSPSNPNPVTTETPEPLSAEKEEAQTLSSPPSTLRNP